MSTAEGRSFVVNTKPSCLWDVDLTAPNAAFLSSLDPGLFTHIVESQVPLLSTGAAKRAALTIRVTYSHALETLFALLFAAVQAPACPLGWILKYRPGDIPKLTAKINNGEPVLSRIDFRGSWQGLSEAIHQFDHPDPNEDRRIKTLFGDTWARLALDVADPVAIAEYNSIKHGLRVETAGFSLTIGSGVHGESPIIDSSSEFGSRFFTPLPIPAAPLNFQLQQAARNWTPVALAVRIELIALSIGNVVSFLKIVQGLPLDPVPYHWPIAQSNIELAWKEEAIIQSMVGGRILEMESRGLCTAEQVLASYGS